METNKVEILSVGIDVGSSTSHLVFSKIMLKRDEHSVSRRFEIEERQIIYESRIINTPLLDNNTIDIDKLTAFLTEEYHQAGIAMSDIQTGAVIVTGEAAGKENAKEIVKSLSYDAGKFVAATAGPNFESLIAAMGSGATARSKDQNKTILSCDIGGGTSNMAISRAGQVISTSCIAVGGRLLGVTPDGKIWRIDNPAQTVLNHIGLQKKVGDIILKEEINRLATVFAEILVEVISGPANTTLARKLMMTDNLAFPDVIDEYSFSGGVAELMYGDAGHYMDIGNILAEKLNDLTAHLRHRIIEPSNKIRATVIGAGAYSLSISGSSGFMAENFAFPMRNVPVVRVDVDRSRLSIQHVISQINMSMQRFGFNEGENIVAFYFKDPVRASYPKLELFAKAIEAALPRSIENQCPIILIFEKDIASSVGNVIKRETDLNQNLLALDELYLEEGDWIDIGAPLVSGQVFPVTVKSLVFHET